MQVFWLAHRHFTLLPRHFAQWMRIKLRAYSGGSAQNFHLLPSQLLIRSADKQNIKLFYLIFGFVMIVSPAFPNVNPFPFGNAMARQQDNNVVLLLN